MKDSCKQHTRGDGSWWLKDARGIECCRVCDDCEEEKKAKYNPAIFDDYEGIEEPIDPDSYDYGCP